MIKLTIPTKKKSVLVAMIDRGSIGYNTFEASREIFDTCIHSSVSTYENKYGLKVNRKWETVNNRLGTKTRVMRYWLEGESIEKAQQLVKFWS
jgi:hypothetical protein